MGISPVPRFHSAVPARGNRRFELNSLGAWGLRDMSEPLQGRFKQVDVLPMVKHYMDSIDLYNVLNKYVPSSE